jgi:hypothetical protein
VKVIVTTITRSPKGNPMRSTRELNAEQIRLGRGAECELRLADPRVPIHARTILLGKNGAQMYEVTEQSADITAVYQAPHMLQPGTTLNIGPFRLDIVEPGTADLALTVELVQALPQNAKAVGKDIFFRATRIPVSRRKLAWILFLPILLWFLILPVLNFFFNHPDAAPSASTQSAPYAHKSPALHQVKTVVALAGDGSWNPGELAAGHQSFASNCKACHSESFTRVKDADCKTCHQNMGDHVSKKVGHVAALDATRCASCHQDHKGALALQQQNTHYFMGECAACHSNITSSLPSTRTENVSDFSRQHPEFRVMVSTGAGTNDLARVRLPTTGMLSEKSALKFPHDVHLAAKGVNGPQGRIKMTCASCHVPNNTGTGFKPVTMKENCQSCHELRFELAQPERQVPHGSVKDVMTTLREFYSYVSVNGIVLNRPQGQTAFEQTERGLPGKAATAAVRLNGSGDVDAQVRAAAHEIFEKTSCYTCHEISRTASTSTTTASGAASWIVAPIKPAPERMAAARFSHDKHAMASCESCHAAKTSKSSHDVLMPKIESCRSCHAGSKAEPQKIISNCGLCHGFHVHTQTDIPANKLLPGNHPVLWPSSHDAALLQAGTMPSASQPASNSVSNSASKPASAVASPQ